MSVVEVAMWRYAALALLIGVASCGAADQASNRTENGPVENTTLMKLDLTSEAFVEGQAIPAQYTCDGANRAPALRWNNPPEGTKSLALVVDDPDAPSGTFRHWGAYDIPADTRSIAAGQSVGSPAVNDFGKSGYGGPCPPPGHGPHHYHFKLFALDVGKLGVGTNAKIADVENEATNHAIARGELIGTYDRK
jgi:Raf kinase inhibitor-like YbhB/YbcL family protein